MKKLFKTLIYTKNLLTAQKRNYFKGNESNILLLYSCLRKLTTFQKKKLTLRWPRCFILQIENKTSFLGFFLLKSSSVSLKTQYNNNMLDFFTRKSSFFGCLSFNLSVINNIKFVFSTVFKEAIIVVKSHFRIGPCKMPMKTQNGNRTRDCHTTIHRATALYLWVGDFGRFAGHLHNVECIPRRLPGVEGSYPHSHLYSRGL
jgi:hypothetical protein